MSRRLRRQGIWPLAFAVLLTLAAGLSLAEEHARPSEAPPHGPLASPHAHDNAKPGHEGVSSPPPGPTGGSANHPAKTGARVAPE